MMSHPSSTEAAGASSTELEHLEQAHYEICTALTILRSNTELVRAQIAREPEDPTRVAVHAHLSELDAAVDRLLDLTVQMRVWSRVPPRHVSPTRGGLRDTRILP